MRRAVPNRCNSKKISFKSTEQEVVLTLSFECSSLYWHYHLNITVSSSWTRFYKKGPQYFLSGSALRLSTNHCMHVTTSPRPSPSIFAYCKHWRWEGGNKPVWRTLKSRWLHSVLKNMNQKMFNIQNMQSCTHLHDRPSLFFNSPPCILLPLQTQEYEWEDVMFHTEIALFCPPSANLETSFSWFAAESCSRRQRGVQRQPGSGQIQWLHSLATVSLVSCCTSWLPIGEMWRCSHEVWQTLTLTPPPNWQTWTVMWVVIRCGYMMTLVAFAINLVPENVVLGLLTIWDSNCYIMILPWGRVVL